MALYRDAVVLVADSHPPVPKQHHQTGAGERGPQETDLRPRGCGELLPVLIASFLLSVD